MAAFQAVFAYDGSDALEGAESALPVGGGKGERGGKAESRGVPTGGRVSNIIQVAIEVRKEKERKKKKGEGAAIMILPQVAG